MAHTTPCNQCSQAGLPILFTRYAAAYSATQEGMDALETLKPAGTLKAQPGGVSLKTAKYNVRMLRTGYLYLRLESVCRLPEWLAFVVHPHGYLTKIDINHPDEATAEAACRPNEWGANRSLVWIKDVDNLTKLQFMFHPDPIDPDHLKTVIGKAPDKYMQSFDVKAWEQGKTAQSDTMLPDTLDTMVMEFKAVANKALQTVGTEQVFGIMGRSPQERGWGDYSEESKGRHFAGQNEEFREVDGTLSRAPDGTPIGTQPGSIGHISTGSYVSHVRGVPYDQAHGPRLRQMIDFLKAKKGAVVACDDPIGMAQELSMHHLSAAIPYMDWLKETDAKGVSNHWKQAASESVRSVRSALSRKAVETYDTGTALIRLSADRVLDDSPFENGTYKVAQPDGSVKEMTAKEYNRHLHEAWKKAADSRDSDRSVKGVDAASTDALTRVTQYCDMGAIDAFDALDKAEIDKRDTLMDKIAIDLHAWLKADALTEKALGRYNEKASIDSGDGASCAGQLCAILLQIDSAPKGREWYATLDMFTPGKKNLMWRMLSLNNADLSTEMHAALESLTTPLPPAGLEVHDAEENSRQQKAYATMLAALGQLNKTLGASDKIGKGLPKVFDANRKWLDRLQTGSELAKVTYDSPHAVLGVAAMARFKALPAARGESFIAKAQLLLMARGLGRQAMAFTRNQQADALTKTTAKQARYTQRRIERAIQSQIAQGAGKDMRLPNILLGLNALAILPALANANTRRDERTTTELLGTMAGLAGSMRQWRADLYEKALLKQLPDMVYKTHKAGMTQATQVELLGMKAGAARFVAAGAVVGVAWDAADAAKAHAEQEEKLAFAYGARAATGLATISGVVIGARYLTAPLWLLRFNFYTLIATVVATVVIGKLKGDAWANWLQAQPFRKAESKKIPHGSEKETMSKLANALAEIE